jgi:hypothetical protein
MLNVSTEVKAIVHAEAKAICATAKVRNDQFNQDLNAYCAFRSLAKVGVQVPDALIPKVLEVLKISGNASALRQAISEEKKKTDIASEISRELLGKK